MSRSGKRARTCSCINTGAHSEHGEINQPRQLWKSLEEAITLHTDRGRCCTPGSQYKINQASSSANLVHQMAAISSTAITTDQILVRTQCSDLHISRGGACLPIQEDYLLHKMHLAFPFSQPDILTLNSHRGALARTRQHADDPALAAEEVGQMRSGPNEQQAIDKLGWLRWREEFRSAAVLLII